tara:strand:- start:618 stop:980 length:363 start_codon:yes stop_codon:yes gene_type:complete
MDRINEFLDEVNRFPMYQEFKNFFWSNYPKGEYFAIDTTSMLKAIMWENDCLYVIFANDSEYIYYDVPSDVFLLGCFTEWLVEFREQLNRDDRDLDMPELKVSGWFHDIVKDEWDYTRLN